MRSDRRTRRARSLLSALGFLVVGFSSSVGRAVPPEYLRNMVLHPTDAQTFVVRYESAYGGLLFSRDGGRTMQIVPGRSFYDYNLNHDVPLLIGGDGKLQVALDSGLLLDDGLGCFPPPPAGFTSASAPEVSGLWVADLAAHPSDPDTTFLVTTGDTKGKHAGLWKRTKQGLLTALGMSEPGPGDAGQIPFIATGLEVVARTASSDGLRFLVVGTSYNYATTPAKGTPVLRVSDDLGMTWTSHAIPDPNMTGGNPHFLLVQGSEPFKALVYLQNGFGDDAADPIDPIFVTKDGAASFAPFLDKVQVAGEAALLPSGQILIADRGAPGGLWSASNFDAAPGKIADYSVHCLAYQAKTQKVFMCKLNELGYYDVASGSFCAIFRMNETRTFVSCPSAPLTQNMRAIDQVCGGWCGAAHYPSSPFCSTFSVAPGRLCGPAAYAYDNDDPNPDKRWIEPPGSLGAPRCMGFAGLPDAGVGSTQDAGVGTSDASVNADAASATGDAGEEPEPDSGASMPEDAGAPARKKHSGCQVALSGDGHAPRAALFGALALLTGLGVRRQRRVQRG